jgi:hypothetical protein
MKNKSEVQMEMITDMLSTSHRGSPEVEPRALVRDTKILSIIAAARSAESSTRKYGKKAGARLVSALETENVELRKQVVELALEILDLQLRLRPGERSLWGDIGTR